MAVCFRVITSCFALLALLSCRNPLDPLPPANENSDYAHFIVGNPADVITQTSPGLLLAGGGADVDAAFLWLIRKSGGGDIVVLRASGTDAYNGYIAGLGPVDSVETIITFTREAAYSSFVLDRVAAAEALFIAGGDQASYVRLWKNTPLADLINTLARRGIPIGGSSAGLAIMAEFIYPARLGSAVSANVLNNPFHQSLMLERDFFDLPYLAATITDSHFADRDRMGRLIAFLARIIKDGWASSARGIGIDEGTAVLVEADGSAAVLGRGAAYFLQSEEPPELCQPNQPLTFRNITVTKVFPGGSFNLANWLGTGGNSYRISAMAGRLESDIGTIY